MKKTNRAYLFLHLAVFLWGFTAVLGDLINLTAGVLVWWRVAITSLVMACWPGLLKEVFSLPKPVITRYVGIGIIVALHWLCFFGSVKFANASIALITFSTTAFFTSLLEPWIFKTTLKRLDVILGLMVIPAMVLVIYDFDSDRLIGFWFGILSAFLCAYFTILNRKEITAASPQAITFIEMSTSLIFLTILSPVLFLIADEVQIVPDQIDVYYLIILSVGCTILPFILHLISLKYISAFASNLVFNLEPVYGIVLAILILKEHKELNVSFYLGVLIIISLIVIYSFLNKKMTLKHLDPDSN